jgi:hypothetical protein
VLCGKKIAGIHDEGRMHPLYSHSERSIDRFSTKSGAKPVENPKNAPHCNTFRVSTPVEN